MLSWGRGIALVVLSFVSVAEAGGLKDVLEALAQPNAGGVYQNHGRFGPGRPGRPGRPDRPGYPPPGRGGYARMECTASDRGWEEHRWPHYSCQECLAHHGSCIETCEEIRDVHLCRIEGRDFRTGQVRIFEGRGFDSYEAERDADYQCYRAGYRECRYAGCTRVSERRVVSRHSCR